MYVTCLYVTRATIVPESMGRQEPHVHWVTRWLVPDLALALSLVTLAFLVFVFDAPRQLFRDSDTGWHIRTGESILDGAGLPRSDPYSFTRPGQPWFAWEWGADAAMGVAHRVAGPSGVVWLYSLVIAACTWLWFQLTWAVGGDFLISCLMMPLMLSTANLHWLARPHLFSWLFLLGALIYSERIYLKPHSRFSLADGLLVVAGAALWSNLHASFFLAPGIALLYGASHVVKLLIWDLDRQQELGRARWFGRAALCAAAGTLINPYGWNLHRHVWAYLQNGELLDRIGEFQSFNFHSEGALQILLALGAASVGGVLALSQRRLAHCFLACLFVGLALRSARGLPIAALLLLPLANSAIAQALANATGLQPRFQRWVSQALQYSRNLRAIDRGLSGVALIPVFTLLMIAWLRLPAVAARTGFPANEFPVAAAAELAKLPGGARILAPDKFGGYLIYRFKGERKVYFDGRSDFYGSDFMKAYLQLIEVRPGWMERLESHGFTHALLPNRYSLVPALQQLGWRTRYSDTTAILLEKP